MGLSILILLVTVLLQEGLVNGELASPKQLPYQVYVLGAADSEQKNCGGVIVSEWVILTPADCVRNVDSVDIYFGAIRVNNNNEVGQQQLSSSSENILILPNNATALIRLPSKLTFDEYIQPAWLPEANKDYSDATILASAWIDSDEYKDTKQLVFFEATILSPEHCTKQLQDDSFVENSYFCLTLSNDLNFNDSDVTIVLPNTDGSFTLLSTNSIVVNHPQARDEINEFLLFQVLETISDGLNDLVKSMSGH